MMKLFITALIATLAITACSNTKKMSKTASPLYGTKWLLKKIYTNDIAEDINTKAFIRFDQAKQSAGGNGSCNSFGSTATITGSEITFKNIFSTKMYCEGVQQIENTFFNLLGKVNRFEINENTLKLYDEKDMLLEFAAE